MWNKREEPVGPRQASVPPGPTGTSAPEIRKETLLVSSTPFRAPETESRNTATIGKAVRIKGEIFTKEDLYVDGDVDGIIESQDNKVTIGPNGRVQASVHAREVVILGQVQGDVEATDKVDLRKDAKLVGNITTARISIEDGALFKGSIDIRKAEAKAAPPPAPAPAVSTPAAASAASAGVPVGAAMKR